MQTILYGEHNVWKVLNKEKYTEEGIRKVEEIYDFLSKMMDDIGIERMQQLSDMWSDFAGETFRILAMLTHESEK